MERPQHRSTTLKTRARAGSANNQFLQPRRSPTSSRLRNIPRRAPAILRRRAEVPRSRHHGIGSSCSGEPLRETPETLVATASKCNETSLTKPNGHGPRGACATNAWAVVNVKDAPFKTNATALVKATSGMTARERHQGRWEPGTSMDRPQHRSTTLKTRARVRSYHQLTTSLCSRDALPRNIPGRAPAILRRRAEVPRNRHPGVGSSSTGKRCARHRRHEESGAPERFPIRYRRPSHQYVRDGRT